MVRLFEVGPIIWETVMEELEKRFEDIEFKAKDITPDWRKLAHRRKIDREIFEKRSSPPTYHCHHCTIYTLQEMFLSWFSGKSKRVPKQYKAFRPQTNKNHNANDRTKRITVAERFAFGKDEVALKDFDHVLIGKNTSSLYAAALLAKNGHRVCVLDLPQSPKSTIFPTGAPCAADIEQITVNKLERYQFLLDCVQSWKRDPHNRVQFTPLGSPESGFVHSIVNLKHPNHRLKDQILTLRYGPESIAHEVSSVYPINRSGVSAVLQKLKVTMGHISSYLYSHTLSNQSNDISREIRSEYEEDTNYQTIADFVKSSIEKSLYDNNIEQSDVINALTALSATVGSQESCLKNTLSSLGLGGVINTETGVFVPRHGTSEMETALAKVIEEAGGRIFSNLRVKGVEIEEKRKEDVSTTGTSAESSYRAIGVTITDEEGKNECLLKAKGSVISAIGLLGSYATLVPSECVEETTREQLSLLQEKRPKVKVVLWLNGEAADLGISSVNYYEVCTSTETAGGLTSVTGAGKEHEMTEKLASSYAHIWSPSAQNPDWKEKDIQVLVFEFEVTEPIVRPETFRWQANDVTPYGPKFYVSKRDDSTNPNHPDYGLTVGGRLLALTASQKSDYQRRAELLMHSLYPKTFGKVTFAHVEEPSLGGYTLSNNTSKFASSLSLRTEIESFYLTGEDFAFNGYMGALQGGWLTANVVLGYSIKELSAGKNLFVDLYSMST